MLPKQARHERIRRCLALALNCEWPQLERTRSHVARLRAVPIIEPSAAAGMPIVATVATDGGQGRLSLAPISIQIVRVADNRGVMHFEEFIPQSLQPEEVIRGFFAAEERLGKFLRFLDVSIDDLLPDNDFHRSNLVGMLRELLEWAALLKLATQPRPALLLRDGLLRSVLLRERVFQAVRRRFEELTVAHGHLLVGAAKRSSVINYLAVAFGVHQTFEGRAPAYVRIPGQLEREAAPAQYRWVAGRAMGQLHLARLDAGQDVALLPVDLAEWQQDRVDEAMGCLRHSARGSYPRRGYPQELSDAHDHARFSGLELEMLESELLHELTVRSPDVARQAGVLMLQGRNLFGDANES